MIPGRIARPTALTLLALALTACGSSPKTHFYTLASGAVPAEAARNATQYSVAVGPVTLPDMVDRPQLVVRVAANQVTLLDQHRWAEPLKSEIPRVIAGNLAQLLGITRVSADPRGAGGDAEYRVRVDIQRFESTPGESATLEALWSVQRAAGGETRSGRSLLRMPTDGSGYDAVAAAHARAVGRLSEELAAVIRAMHAVPR